MIGEQSIRRVETVQIECERRMASGREAKLLKPLVETDCKGLGG